MFKVFKIFKKEIEVNPVKIATDMLNKNISISEFQRIHNKSIGEESGI